MVNHPAVVLRSYDKREQLHQFRVGHVFSPCVTYTAWGRAGVERANGRLLFTNSVTSGWPVIHLQSVGSDLGVISQIRTYDPERLPDLSSADVSAIHRAFWRSLSTTAPHLQRI